MFLLKCCMGRSSLSSTAVPCGRFQAVKLYGCAGYLKGAEAAEIKQGKDGSVVPPRMVQNWSCISLALQNMVGILCLNIPKKQLSKCVKGHLKVFYREREAVEGTFACTEI